MGKDNRDWVRYNENLVQRGEILLKLDVLKDWQTEVATMNQGKRGRPFAYPDLMMLLYGMMRTAFQLPYRQLEGLARGLSKLVDIPAPDYTTFSIRLPKIKLGPAPRIKRDKPVILAVDSSGVKLTQKGQWFFQPHDRKQFVKIHLSIDVETKQVVSVKFSPGQVNDNRYFRPVLIEALGKVKVSKVLADSGYDSTPNYSLLRRHGIRTGIKPRDSSTFQSYPKIPRTARSAAVKQWMKDPERWKDDVGYRKRNVVESFYASFKGQFGEYVRSRNWLNIVEELYLKVWLYNLWIGLPGRRATT